MATTNKQLEQPAFNAEPNTWGTGSLNQNFGYLDTALGGATSLNATGLGGTTVTLTVAQARPLTLNVTGTPGGIVTYSTPASVGGQWVVRNNTTGGYDVRIQSASAPGVYVAIAAGNNLQVSCDGTATGMVRNSTAGVNAAAGSTTQLQYNSSGALAGSAGMTFDGTKLTVTGFSNTGNTVLGDASGDTLTINSNAASIPNNLNIGSNTLFISGTSQQVGIGTITLGSDKLVVAGTIRSTAGGIVFPDNSIQTTAAGSGTGSVTSVVMDTSTTGLLVNGATSATITTFGTFLLGGTLGVSNGGTGATTATAAFTALAPSQTSNSGKYLTTNGTAASWGSLTLTSGTTVISGATSGYLLYNNAGVLSAMDPTSILPSQTSNSGKYLTTNGTTTSWGTLALTIGTTTISGATSGYVLYNNAGVIGATDANNLLPAQSGNNGKYLTTNGATASWGSVTIPTGITVGTTTVSSGTSGYVLYNNAGILGNASFASLLPTQTGNAGKALVTDGTNYSWTYGTVVLGTTPVTGTANRVPYVSGGVLTSSANLTFSGTALTTVDISITGNTTLGDGAGDTITINASTASIPNTLNIGSDLLYLSSVGGVVGIGTSATGTDKLTVAGTVKSTTGGFVFPDNTTQTTAAALPTGAVMPFAGNSAPTGWLFCAGQAVSRSSYSALFSAIGTAYGVGDGSTTFNLPDLRGRVPAGLDNLNGSAASRLTSTTMSPDGNTYGATGGTQTATATVTTTGSATGSLSFTTSAAVEASPSPVTGGGGQASTPAHYHTGTTTGSLSVSATGTSSAFGNVQPTLLMAYIIKT